MISTYDLTWCTKGMLPFFAVFFVEEDVVSTRCDDLYARIINFEIAVKFNHVAIGRVLGRPQGRCEVVWFLLATHAEVKREVCLKLSYGGLKCDRKLARFVVETSNHLVAFGKEHHVPGGRALLRGNLSHVHKLRCRQEVSVAMLCWLSGGS